MEAAAEGEPSSQDYLASLIASRLDDVASIAIWEVTWQVDTGRVPPLEVDSPLVDRRLIQYDVREVAER